MSYTYTESKEQGWGELKASLIRAGGKVDIEILGDLETGLANIEIDGILVSAQNNFKNTQDDLGVWAAMEIAKWGSLI